MLLRTFLCLSFCFWAFHAHGQDVAQKGNQAFEHGKFSEAITLFNKALPLEEEGSLSRLFLFFNLALSHKRRGDLAKAVEVLDRGLKEYPQSKRLRELRGEIQEKHQLGLAEKAEEEFEYDQALAIYEELLKNEPPSVDKAYLLYRKGFAQRGAGYLEEASATLEQALGLDPTQMDYLSLRKEIQVLLSRGGRSKEANRYYAFRDLGSALRLEGNLGLLHIFVMGKNSAPWEKGLKAESRRQNQAMSTWLQRQVTELGEVSMGKVTHRYLTVDNHPFFRGNRVPEFGASEKYVRAWFHMIRQSFQVQSFRVLFDQEFGDLALDNRAIMFHVNQEGRAFALPVVDAHHEGDIESLILYFHVERLGNPKYAVISAHELLHLFGADDLYNKVRSSAYSSRSVMNFGAYTLSKSHLSELTKYAIGWSEEAPSVPTLEIIESHHQPIQKGANP